MIETTAGWEKREKWDCVRVYIYGSASWCTTGNERYGWTTDDVRRAFIYRDARPSINVRSHNIFARRSQPRLMAPHQNVTG